MAAAAAPESGKFMRGTSRNAENVTTTEKRPSVRLARQETVDDAVGSDKSNDVSTPPPSVLETATTSRQPTRFSTRIVKRPRRDLSPPESPVKKGSKSQLAVFFHIKYSFY